MFMLGMGTGASTLGPAGAGTMGQPEIPQDPNIQRQMAMQGLI